MGLRQISGSLLTEHLMHPFGVVCTQSPPHGNVNSCSYSNTVNTVVACMSTVNVTVCAVKQNLRQKLIWRRVE
jgi:hypothetical protein